MGSRDPRILGHGIPGSRDPGVMGSGTRGRRAKGPSAGHWTLALSKHPPPGPHPRPGTPAVDGRSCPPPRPPVAAAARWS